MVNCFLFVKLLLLVVGHYCTSKYFSTSYCTVVVPPLVLLQCVVQENVVPFTIYRTPVQY